MSVCDGDEVNIYDGRSVTTTLSEDAFLKGWLRPRKKLWRTPLQSQVTDLNINNLLLNGPTGREYLNYLYTVCTTASVLAHFEDFNYNQVVGATINNMYELPSLACAVRYLHGATEFLTKAT